MQGSGRADNLVVNQLNENEFSTLRAGRLLEGQQAQAVGHNQGQANMTVQKAVGYLGRDSLHNNNANNMQVS